MDDSLLKCALENFEGNSIVMNVSIYNNPLCWPFQLATTLCIGSQDLSRFEFRNFITFLTVTDARTWMSAFDYNGNGVLDGTELKNFRHYYLEAKKLDDNKLNALTQAGKKEGWATSNMSLIDLAYLEISVLHLSLP